ncbi:ankyrin repeat domain-containing protein [Sulfitobacter aestuariivivens]
MTGGRTDREIIVDYCAKGNIAGLVDAQRHLGNFPKGGDGTFGNRWISYAIVSGNPAAVTWMINEGADLNFRGDDGYTVFDDCLELEGEARHEILSVLIAAGADVNQHGSQDWTPLHRAAVMDDERAMVMLMDAGADRDRRTRIDDCTTPAEEARLLGHPASADFIDAHVPDRKGAT